MQLDVLNRVLAGGRWFSFNAGLEAVRAIPELLDGLPYISGEPPGIVTNCRDVIRPLLKSPGIGADPLTVGLYRLVEQGLLVSPGAAVIPLLEAWRQLRLKVLSLPIQARRMEASFQSARLGSAIATLRKVPALATVIAQEQTALALSDLELEEDGDLESRRRSVVVTRLAGLLRAPEETTRDRLIWPRAIEPAPGEGAVLAISLSALRNNGLSHDSALIIEKIQALSPDSLTLDLGVTVLLVNLSPLRLIKLNLKPILGKANMGLGVGMIHGGTDGRTTRIVGPAIEHAITAMIRGRLDEISILESNLPIFSRFLSSEGGTPGQHGSRSWSFGNLTFYADMVENDIYAIRSQELSASPESEFLLNYDFTELLEGDFGSVPKLNLGAIPVAPTIASMTSELEIEEDEGPSMEIEDEDEEDWVPPPASPSRPLFQPLPPKLPDLSIASASQPEEAPMFLGGGDTPREEAPMFLGGAENPKEEEGLFLGEAPDDEKLEVGEPMFLGGMDESLKDESVAMRSPGASTPLSKAPPHPDFGYLLAGYVYFPKNNGYVFGRTYDKMLVDHHFVQATDALVAHRRFLQAKIQEGFLPRPDLVSEIPTGIRTLPLDAGMLKEVWGQIA